MNNLFKLMSLAKKPNVIKFLGSSYFSGYLKDVGWFNSFEKNQPVDADFQPIAWVTYPFMHFIEPRLPGVKNLFEYGSGNSTLYYAQFVDKLTGVEHDKEWYDKIKNKLPENANLFYCELNESGEYSSFCNKFENKFDMIIIDGRDRVNCIATALGNVSECGVIVLDDSERGKYKPGIDLLIKNGFRKIDFWGISPGLFYTKCTTVFYRRNNILGI